MLPALAESQWLTACSSSAAVHHSDLVQLTMIFISHAVRDKPVVDAFVTLLTSGANVRTEEIFCSSSSGSDIDPGDEFVHAIRDGLINAELVILFITPHYYDSVFCVAEMGGAWALGKPMFPFVASDVDREIGNNMLGRQTERVDKRGINSLFERLRKMLPARKWDTNLYEARRDAFLSEFESKYPSLPKPAKVSREEMDREQGKAAAAVEMMRDAESRLTRAKEQIAALEAAKNAADVKRIRGEFASSERERWEQLRDDAWKPVNKLTAPERRAVFASYAGEPWRPSREADDYWGVELNRGVAGHRIVVYEDFGPRRYVASQDHPALKPVFRALNAMRDFISSEISEELTSELEEEYEAPVRLDNLDFWEAALVDSRLID